MAGISVPRSLPPELRRAWKAAREQGWTWRLSPRGNAMMWLPPRSTVLVAVHCTPGTANRGLANTIGQLRKAGLRW
jgi:hypothetical protein